MHFDACHFIPVLFQDVMIAFDQQYIDGGKVVPPAAEQIELVVFAAVEQVAYDEQLSRLEILNLCEEPVKVLFVDGRRYGDARFAEMSCLAEMKIG